MHRVRSESGEVVEDWLWVSCRVLRFHQRRHHITVHHIACFHTIPNHTTPRYATWHNHSTRQHDPTPNRVPSRMRCRACGVIQFDERDAVNVITRLRDGRYMVFEQSKYGFPDGFSALAPVGGFIDDGESSLEV